MTNLEFFKQQAKNLLKDFDTRVFNEDEGFYDYHPRFFNDIDRIVYFYKVEERDSFSLMNAQHVISKMAGFSSWKDILNSSEAKQSFGRLVLENRDFYESEIGLFTNSPNLLLDDWNIYEKKNNLSNLHDEEKLEIFKIVFLSIKETVKKSKKVKIPKSKPTIDIKHFLDVYNIVGRTAFTIDFSKNEHVQDMLVTLMREKNCSPSQALLSTITQGRFKRICDTKWASIAVDLWGHGEAKQEFELLKRPILKVTFPEEKELLVRFVMDIEKVSFDEAISYFMIFALEDLGYHI